ncbi:ABC transporter ATP-binding protein [Geitlerinema sp. PCC 9228]|uniref:ABC transporter ATP-binding protein n=1 Tax=Geitlerinema sp. PCC 9228 TaxID=111611 RepID=UPI0008F9C738|nr:ABC transporter ATP-binding protein [Geitlerinema sp. PCC 9228]
MAPSRLQQLYSYMRPHRKRALLGILSLLVVNLLGVYIPLVIRDSIDRLQQMTQTSDTNSLSSFVPSILFILLLASMMWFVRVASRLLIFGVGRKVEFDLKQRIFQHLLVLEPGYFASSTVGDIINRATSDVDNVRRLLGFAVLSLINTLFAYVLTLPVMFSINFRLSLMAIAVYPLMLILVRAFSDRLRSEQMEVQENLSNLSELIQEDMSGISLVKIYAQEDNEQNAFQRLNQQLLGSNLKLAKTRNLLFPILTGLSSVSLLILLTFGTPALANGTLEVGGFVALILYVERLVFPTALLGFTLTTYQRGEVSIDRVESILTAIPQIRNVPHPIELPQPVSGRLQANNLTFSYPDTEQPALDGVTFDIQPGEMVAVVGTIGGGKSTLANAIARLIEIDPEQLYLDGCDITQIKLEALRSHIAYVPQESFLFSTTIRENIRYGDPSKSQAEVESAAKLAQVHSEILNFPQQYDTIVGERGITLSGGQRQRVSLARALLVDAPVLILDDALSSVDNQTATEILHNLAQIRGGRTVLFISHQMAAVSTLERIFVMDGGKIIQQGTHQKLLQEEGLYDKLWNQQKLEAMLK